MDERVTEKSTKVLPLLPLCQQNLEDLVHQVVLGVQGGLSLRQDRSLLLDPVMSDIGVSISITTNI